MCHTEEDAGGEKRHEGKEKVKRGWSVDLSPNAGSLVVAQRGNWVRGTQKLFTTL